MKTKDFLKAPKATFLCLLTFSGYAFAGDWDTRNLACLLTQDRASLTDNYQDENWTYFRLGNQIKNYASRYETKSEDEIQKEKLLVEKEKALINNLSEKGKYFLNNQGTVALYGFNHSFDGETSSDGSFILSNDGAAPANLDDQKTLYVFESEKSATEFCNDIQSLCPAILYNKPGGGRTVAKVIFGNLFYLAGHTKASDGPTIGMGGRGPGWRDLVLAWTDSKKEGLIPDSNHFYNCSAGKPVKEYSAIEKSSLSYNGLGYYVTCSKPEIKPTLFEMNARVKGTNGWPWTSPFELSAGYYYTNSERPRIRELDEQVGSKYCSR